MKKILIGSRALNYWIDTPRLIKDSTDWDVISAYPIEGAEFHDLYFLNNAKFEVFMSDKHLIDFNGHQLHVMTLQGLALIKRSHLWRNLSFGKHITHYSKHLKKYCDLNHPLLKERIEMTRKQFPQQGPDLRKSPEDFFNDAVYKRFNHDHLHELFAYEDQPMYTKLQKDKSTVQCHKELWDNLSTEQKLQCVAEETYVLSVERFLVPKGFKYPFGLAYMKALEKVCTTVTSGWFRDYAIENYPEVLELFQESKVQKVKNVLKSILLNR